MSAENHSAKLNPPANPPRIGFALSTMERVEFTSRILPGLDCGGFDLIWCDGSRTPEGRDFANAGHFKNTRLVEVHHDVRGGPDAAIQYSLKRLLALGYDYVGLIENDIQLKPGWLPAMMAAWAAAEKDGFQVGAVTARSMADRVLAAGPEYAVKWNVGAGMVLFSRATAEAVLADYRLGSAKEIHGNFLTSTGVDLSPVWELFMEKDDRPLGADWRYASVAWKSGKVCVGTIPTFAENIDVDIRDFCRTDYVWSATSGLPGHCLTIDQLKTALTCYVPYSKIPAPVMTSVNAQYSANCPVCQAVAPVVMVRKTHGYHRCPACDCVFTPKINATVLETENHGNSLRHDQNQDAVRLKRLAEALGEYPLRLIDFGCGQGETTRYLQAQGLDVTGIDQDTPVQLKDIADDSVDGIMMVEVIEHLFTPHEIFGEFKRVLKPGGVAYLESSFADDKNLATWEYLDPAIGHCTVHTKRSMQQVAERHGFVLRWLNPNVCCLTKGQPAQPMGDGRSASTEVIGAGLVDPLVTVVVSTYRAEKRLRACLENLAQQTLFNRCEILVVDSGSPENERAIALEFQSRHPNVRYVRTGRETLSGAWNRGLELTRSRYWANLNTDDSLRPDALAIFVAALDRHADCALAYADCAWVTQPNETFPLKDAIKTLKFPDYAPVEALFYSLTGCVQFYRTAALRQLGGFDNALRYTADHDLLLRLMAARLKAVHVPEVLSAYHLNPHRLESTNARAAQEQRLVLNRSRENLGIDQIFQVAADSPSAVADALAMLGARAAKCFVPWQTEPLADTAFAAACFHAALELDPENLTAGMNFVVLNQQLQQLKQNEPELVKRWPKMRGWIDLFRTGEGAPSVLVKHAVTGPVYRPAEWSHRPTTEQLKSEPKALQPWITRIDGRHVYLSEDLFPPMTGLRYEPKELQAAANQLCLVLKELPPFYAHFGGAGDALVLLASFYDQHPESVIFSHPNGTGAARALFDAFPKLSKIYFLPQHTEAFFHIVMRYAVYELKNCRGAGATPKFGYDDEWKAGLDLEKKYGITKAPRWAAAFRKNEKSRQVAVAPKGSLSGMIGSKRNIILPEQWPQVIAHILERGFEPVILGTPNEAKDYPALPGCVDARKESFPGQMRVIGECAGLVGADSWAKSFSALAEIPTLVFEPLKGADLNSWKDPSDWVFIEPWPSLKMIRSLEEFKKAFDVRIAKIPGTEAGKSAKPVIVWEGSFLDYGSLSHVNRELTARMPEVTCVGSNVLPQRAKDDAEMRRCERRMTSTAPANASVTVRHQWPPNWSRPQSGLLVVIQPWEYGALPKAWVEQARNVDEFWVPSPLVRQMYVDSGVAPEKVRVIPNGVDTQKFRPGVAPLKLATKKKFKFLFVGGTIFRKGPDILLEAFAQTFTAKDDVCLVIKDFGGDSCYQGQTAEAAVAALKQKPNTPEIIYLKEELASEQMPALYAACDCLVLPYRGEGFGMPVLEAMACGRPVIVTASGATESFVTPEVGWKIPSQAVRLGDRIGEIVLCKKGWLLEPSKSHLGAIMKHAVAHPEDCRKRGAAGRGVAERKFTWDDVAAAVQHRLKELAERAPQRGGDGPSPERTSVKTTAPKLITIPAVAKIGRLDEAKELFAAKDFEAAWNAAIAAIAQRPFHPEAYLLLAEIAQAAGDADSAKRCLQRAQAMAPGWKSAKQFKLRTTTASSTKFTLPDGIATAKSPRLSVCLITKNEEKFLAQCLKSVRGLTAQIVVADTGSTDRTVEIAREFGADVHAFKWCDDFSAARNAALEHATGDWVLMLDADEELTATQHANIQADMQNAAVMGYRLPLVNAGQEIEGRSFIPRLFRNAPGVFFHGRIHEQVFPSLLPLCAQWGLKTELGTAELLHHGYTKELVRDRNKVERNLKLLRQAVEENPTDANLVMNLGLELVRSDDLPAGIVKYREAFDLMSAQPATAVVPELREALLAQFTSQLYKVRGHAEVVQVLNSPLAKHGGLNASLHLALGLSLFELKSYDEAVQQMQLCLATRSQPALTPVNVDIHGAAPWHCTALCRMRAGDVAGAEKAFQSALAEPSRTEPARLDYAKFLQGVGRPVEALQQLHEVVSRDKTNVTAWKLGGEIALSQPDFIEFARDWTGEAIAALPTTPVIAAQRAEALILNGDTAGALPLWEKLWNAEPQPRSLAALILCEITTNKPAHTPRAAADEPATSQAFIGWYQRLIQARANSTLARVNERVEALAKPLPTAAKTLQSALAEAVVG